MSAINPVTDLTRDGEIAVITLNSPPVNALSQTMREGLIAALRAAEADNAAKATLLICAGRTFIAGADISEFDKVQTGASLRDVQDVMDAAKKPIVVAIHGTALGGGLETAMCGHYRVAVPSAKLGQPEVALGLVPGAGGTQRLPRLIGVEKALVMVTDGKPISAKEGLALGLLDALMPEKELREGALAFARQLLADGKGIRRTRDHNEKVTGVSPELFAKFRADPRFHAASKRRARRSHASKPPRPCLSNKAWNSKAAFSSPARIPCKARPSAMPSSPSARREKFPAWPKTPRSCHQQSGRDRRRLNGRRHRHRLRQCRIAGHDRGSRAGGAYPRSRRREGAI